MIARTLIMLFGVFGLALASWAQEPVPEASTTHPVVVELFTSQGCPNCPTANAFLAELATQDNVIALSFAVDYWDYLGWQDTFAMPAFTERQYAYGKALKKPRVYTPQMILNGRSIHKGVHQDRVRKAIHSEVQKPDHAAPVVRAHLNRDGKLVLDITGDASGDVAIWMAAYAPGTQSVEVKGGENMGKQLVQVNMVSGLIKLANWTGGHTRMVLPMPDDGGCAILLQASGQGSILAAAKVESAT